MPDVTIKLVGTNPLLVANGRMADPSNEHAIKYELHKATKPNVRSKAVKEDHQLLLDWLEKEKEIQFHGLIYWDACDGFYMPADNLLYMIREAYFGLGSTAKGADRLLSVLTVDSDRIALTYAGPTDPGGRYNNGLYRTGTVPNRAMGGSKVRVLQPFFKDWSLITTVTWKAMAEEKDFLGKGKKFNRQLLLEHIRKQGESLGIGAYRKSGNYGNFTVELLD